MRCGLTSSPIRVKFYSCNDLSLELCTKICALDDKFKREKRSRSIFKGKSQKSNLQFPNIWRQFSRSIVCQLAIHLDAQQLRNNQLFLTYTRFQSTTISLHLPTLIFFTGFHQTYPPGVHQESLTSEIDIVTTSWVTDTVQKSRVKGKVIVYCRLSLVFLFLTFPSQERNKRFPSAQQ